MKSLKRSRICRVGDRFANLNVGESCDPNDLTRPSLCNLNALNAHWQRE